MPTSAVVSNISLILETEEKEGSDDEQLLEVTVVQNDSGNERLATDEEIATMSVAQQMSQMDAVNKALRIIQQHEEEEE